MGKYSIKDIEMLTGIKAHTLRIWEKRYDIVSAERTDTNIRFYSDAQLKTLLNIALLNQNGIKISKIASLSQDEIRQRAMEMGLMQTSDNYFQGKLIEFMIAMDESKFEATYESSIRKLGFVHQIESVLYPFMRKVGMLWSTGSINPAQEHFATNIIKRRIMREIEKTKRLNENPKRFILFLPEGELHEIGLLIAEYMLRIHGARTLYLGASVPIEDLDKVHQSFVPEYYVTCFIVEGVGRSVREELNYMSDKFPKSEILYFGSSFLLSDIDPPANCNYLSSLHQLDQYAI